MTRAGTKVVTRAESEVDVFSPRSLATSDEVELAFPREEPTLGSEFGF